MMPSHRAEGRKLALVGPQFDHAFALLLCSLLDGIYSIRRVEFPPAFQPVGSENEKTE